MVSIKIEDEPFKYGTIIENNRNGELDSIALKTGFLIFQEKDTNKITLINPRYVKYIHLYS